MSRPSDAETYQRAKAALQASLAKTRGQLALDADDRVRRLEDNLVRSVTPPLFEMDFQADGGEEMQGEMRAPHASSALAVNAFALWRSDPHLLQFADRRGFTAIRFEQQCPTGLDGTPAYFDLFAEAEDASFGVEIKCLEYLTRPAPKYLQGFTEAIEAAHARFGASTHGWLGRVQLLRSTPDHYEVLFAAQLVKQALALSYCNPQSQVSLAYLFWEPSNWRDYDVFRRHHAELDDLAGAVTGDHVSFWFQSFTALFRQWQVQSSPPWCRERSSRALRRGYRQLKHGPA